MLADVKAIAYFGGNVSTTPATLTVVIQDSQLMQVSRMNYVFSAEQGYFVAFCPFELSEFFAYCHKFEPCVAIADLGSADARDPAAAEAIRSHRSVKLLARSDNLCEKELEALLMMGCWGLIGKNADHTVLRKAVDTIARGEIWASRRQMTKLFRRLALSEERKLSPREREILKLLASDSTNKAIAETLFISPETLRWHLRNLYTKTGIRDRRSIVAYARQDLGDLPVNGVAASADASGSESR
jgi:DNA-binding NarL/FixJ family response regulator